MLSNIYVKKKFKLPLKWNFLENMPCVITPCKCYFFDAAPTVKSYLSDRRPYEYFIWAVRGGPLRLSPRGAGGSSVGLWGVTLIDARLAPEAAPDVIH